MSEEKKVKVVLDIGGTVGDTLRKSINLVTGDLLKLGSVADKVFRDKFSRAIKNSTGDTKAFHRASLNAYNAVGNSISKLGRGFTGLAADIGAAFYFVKRFSHAYDEYVMGIFKGKQKLAMSADNYAGLKYAAGGDSETVEKGIKLFEKNVATNQKNAVKALATLGVNFKELRKKTPTDALIQVMDAYSKYKGNKAGLAQLIFGRGGAEMAPFLNKGGDWMRKQLSDSKAFGLTPSEEDQKNAVRYAQSLRQIAGIQQGVSLSIGRAFIGPFERIGEVMVDFYRKHAPEINEWLGKLGEKIEEAIPSVERIEQWVGVAEAKFTAWKDAIWPVVESLGGWKTIIGVVLAMPFAPFIGSLGALAAAFFTLGSAMLAAEIPILPFVAAAAALGGAGFLVWKYWDKISPIFDGVRPAIADLGKAFGSLVDAMRPLWDIAGPAMKKLGEILGGVFVGWLKFEIEMFAKAFQAVAAGINAAVSAGSKVKDLWNQKGPGAPGGFPAPGANDPTGLAPGSNAKPSANPTPSQSKASKPVTIHNTINVHATPGMDAHQVAKMVMDRLNGTQYALASGALYDV